MPDMPHYPFLHDMQEPQKKTASEIIGGIIAALIMAIIILGLLNVFSGWAFGWRVHF